MTLSERSTVAEIADEAVRLARSWSDQAKGAEENPTTRLLSAVLAEPGGLEFTLGFVDRVVRPEDLIVAGLNLHRLSRTVPRALPPQYRLALRVGGFFALGLPWIVVPIARRVMRRLVSHLIIDAEPAGLGERLGELCASGSTLNINLLGEAVLGHAEARRRLDGTIALVEREDVDYVSVKVSAIASQISMWAFDETVQRIVAELMPLYTAARASDQTFVNLDMEEYRDLDLTVAVFERLMKEAELADLEIGIVLQAYLPDSVAALETLTELARQRKAAGGAGIRIRIVKGANLAMERVEAVLHGWPQAPWPTKVLTDANYKRLLVRALTPERTSAVRIGIAGHNLFDIAFAWLLAEHRGVTESVEFEMLLGMATAQALVVSAQVGGIRLYTPVVPTAEFDSAISYLVRRLEETAAESNFLSAVFDPAIDEELFAREEARFRAAVTELSAGRDVQPRRNQNRLLAQPESALPRRFSNEPDTDSALADNRAWGRAVLKRAADSKLGLDTIRASRIDSVAEVEALYQDLGLQHSHWAGQSVEHRAAVLGRAADALASGRAELIEVMASETGKTIAEADTEVSEAIDFARYYAVQSLELWSVPEARFTGAAVTVVAPPWNFPVAIPTGSVLAALVTGSTVVLKPAPQAVRCAAVLCEALWASGVPRQVLALVDVQEGPVSRALISHPSVDRVILTGAWQTARLFRSWRPELALLAETSGKNAIIVTPSADYDQAVADIVRSAFGHAGQKCSAASLVILVGSVARSKRFRTKLIDAVSSLRVGYPDDPSVAVPPLIEAPSGKLRDGLTTLGPGETWLIEPRQVDDSGRLWSPGIRAGVLPGSPFHTTEYFGPVLGIMTARSLDGAIALQNATAYGLTAGLQSLDPDEVSRWLAMVEAGNLYVNRGITGALVQRQPFGGWKRSAVGPGAKTGGPNYLAALGEWSPIPQEPARVLSLAGISDDIAGVISASTPYIPLESYGMLRASALSDQEAWLGEFGLARDISGLGLERNVFRYRPVPAVIRLAESGSIVDLIRCVLAGRRAGSAVSVTSGVLIPPDLAAALATVMPGRSGEVLVESDEHFLARARAGGLRDSRLRLIGGDADAFARAVDGATEPTVYSGRVTASGRIEMLPFLREQTVSITAHRLGNPDLAFAELVL